jgi:hypothetical protein
MPLAETQKKIRKIPVADTFSFCMIRPPFRLFPGADSIIAGPITAGQQAGD